MPDAQPPRVHSRTVELGSAAALLEFASPSNPLVWRRGADILVGVGEALRLSFHGPNRMLDAAEAWRDLVASAEVRDDVKIPGSGVLAFGSMSFDAESPQSSVLIVPRTVLGVRDGRAFRTDVSLAAEAVSTGLEQSPIAAVTRAEWQQAGDGEGHQAAVRAVLSEIERDRVEKVVLARAVHGTIDEHADLRATVEQLAESYPDTWVFAVDGLLGASPETLLAVEGGQATVRVLAGTIGRDQGSPADLLDSPKDRAEHSIAVESAVAALARAGVTEVRRHEPIALELPDLWHLATDLDCRIADGHTLATVAALHPTAAVAGTPTDAALQLIAELEPVNRGRYAGPVGWLDADGNAEWAIALRCALVEGGQVTAWAGGGIVAGSDPELEYAETELKLRTIRSAL